MKYCWTAIFVMMSSCAATPSDNTEASQPSSTEVQVIEGQMEEAVNAKQQIPTERNEIATVPAEKNARSDAPVPGAATSPDVSPTQDPFLERVERAHRKPSSGD